jgi:hypothetical protein
MESLIQHPKTRLITKPASESIRVLSPGLRRRIPPILIPPDVKYVEREDEEDWSGFNREVPAESTNHDDYDMYSILPQTINPQWAAGWQ